MALNFRELWKSLVPSWLNSGDGELLGYTLMYLNDLSLERLYLGHLARMPHWPHSVGIVVLSEESTSPTGPMRTA
jgi:hypothetical protein